MSMCDLLLETGSAPHQLRIGVDGEPPPTRPFFTIHVTILGDVREEAIWWTALSPEQVGSLHPQEIKNIRDDSMYCAYICCEERYQYGNAPNIEALLLKQYFRVIENQVLLLPESEGQDERRKQIAQNLSPLFSEEGHESNLTSFEVVVFFVGVYLYFTQAMKGVSLIPISPGLSNDSVFDAVSNYLLERHNVEIPNRDAVERGTLHQPMFAIDFHQIIAPTEESAFKFALKMAHDFSTVIASERGDKPFHALTFILDRNTGNWRIVPTNFDLRGNILPTIFPHVNAQRIETLYPIIQSRPFARLVLELYVQSLAERDRSFRFLRQWTLLEMIADKRIIPTKTPLVHFDGSPILLDRGKPATTLQRADTKVYAYLRGGQVTSMLQQMPNGSTRVWEVSRGDIDLGGGVVRLWDSVAAAYAIRNDVAHEGRFDLQKQSKNDQDILCKELFTGGFLDFALENAVQSELSKNAEQPG